MNYYETLLRDAYPQRGTKVGPEDYSCIRFAEYCREQTRSGRLTCVWFHVPNEGKRSFRQGSLQRSKGLTPGTADYVFLHSTGAVCIEFKTKTGAQSKNQRDFEDWCDNSSVPYFLVRSTEEAIALIEGIPALWSDPG